MKKYWKFLLIIIAVMSVTAFFSCNSLTVEKYYREGIIASASPIATKVGIDILKNGGNAYDASVAVAFAEAVCFPEAGNIGGGGFALIRTAGKNEIMALDFREKAPLAASLDMYLDKNGDVIPKSSLVGAKAAGVPGTVAGLFELWARHGSMDWHSLIEPAINLADSGFILSEYVAGAMDEHTDDFKMFPETARLFLNNGRPYRTGERLVQSDLARTLELIARDSTSGFYAGETALKIISTMEKHGGLITLEDLAAYKPVWRNPIHIVFDSLDIYSMPPPSSGGVILGQILKLIEPYDFARFTSDSPGYIHLFVEACRLAYADRAVHLGDPDFIDNPVLQLLDSSYIETRRSLIDPEKAGQSSQVVSGLPEKTDSTYVPESESTTHFCVADKWGNIVSLTYTLNASFGSKLVVDSAGFLLNDEMDDFSIKPGQPNLYGLIGGKANEIAPAKRMLSSMSPTIVMYDDKPYMALGSPGGSKIITTVAEAIIGIRRFGLSPIEMVRHPRFHHQWLPDTLYLEEGGFPQVVKKDLEERGHTVKERSKYSDLQIIMFEDGGFMTGASDPRRGGLTSGF